MATEEELQKAYDKHKFDELRGTSAIRLNVLCMVR